MEPSVPQPIQQPPNMPQQQPTQSPTPTITPMVEPEKKLPKRAKILIIVASIVLVCGIGGIIVAAVVLKNNDKEVQGFLSSIYASNNSAAYDYFSPELKQVQSRDVFESQLQPAKAAGLDSSCSTEWTTNSVASSTDSGNTKEVGGTLKCDKASFDANFKLVKRGDSYKLYSYSIQPK